MKITLEEVREVALLARLALDDQEAERLRGELESILGYVEKVSELDVADVPPTTHAVPMDCPLRADQVGAHLSQDAALANAPRREESYFAVPKMVPARQGEAPAELPPDLDDGSELAS